MAEITLKINNKNYKAHLGMGFVERTMLHENPEDGVIFNINTWRLIMHAVANADEREKRENTLTIHDIYDWVDSKGASHKDVKDLQIKFQIEFCKYMKTHAEGKEAIEAIDQLIEALTPEERKKNSKKSGIKTL